jgi:hypothetical protein
MDNYPREVGEQTRPVHAVLTGVESFNLLFFRRLFTLLHGLERAESLTLRAQYPLSLTGGDLDFTATLISWGSADLRIRHP